MDQRRSKVTVHIVFYLVIGVLAPVLLLLCLLQLIGEFMETTGKRFQRLANNGGDLTCNFAGTIGEFVRGKEGTKE